MAAVKILYDKIGNTLTVWFDDPAKEHVSEETGEEIVLMKDSAGHVIGFEKLNFSSEQEQDEQLRVAFEAVSA